MVTITLSSNDLMVLFTGLQTWFLYLTYRKTVKGV